MIWFSSILMIGGALMAVGLVFRQIALIRSGEVRPLGVDATVASWQRRIDRFYFGFSSFFVWLARLIAFNFLVVACRLISFFRLLLFRLERRFSRLVEGVRGRRMLDRRGSVSFFLANLKTNFKKGREKKTALGPR